MHSWYSSMVFQVFPAAGITFSFGLPGLFNKDQRHPTTPTKAGSPRSDSFPLKQRWSPSIFSTTLVAVSSNHAVESEPRNDREIEEERINRTWSACNPLSACSNGNSVQITPISDGNGGSTAADKENREVGALDTSFLSLQQPQNDGTLSANVSASHLEELVMKEAEDPKAPLVILFGWAGCRDRYLSKYSAYYQKEGYAVIRFTAPISKIRSFSSYRQFALEIYEKILEQECNRPIIFHCFSMNGCSLFTALWDLLDVLQDGDEIKQRCKGLIFDSSPANVLPWQAANAVSFATFPPGKSGAVPREAYRIALAGIFSVHRALVWLRSNFNNRAYEKSFSFFRLLCFEDLPKNQLYLYSSVDEICVRESIEHFQNVQKERRANITQICWADSQHCQHFRRFEKEYTQHCLKFVQNTFKS